LNNIFDQKFSMQLIADSGSSKTDWRLIANDGAIQQFECKGLNPDFHNSESIFQEVSKTFDSDTAKSIQEIHFYGSGSSS